MVAVGEAVGFAQVVQLNPVAGVHTKVIPPLAVSKTLFPLQILAEDGLITATAPLVTVTVTEIFALQPDAFVT